MRARVCANSVLPEPVGPISRMFDFASSSSSRTLRIPLGVRMPSRDFTNEDLFSSRMISMHSSTHSSQINTVGPAMSLRTSCWLLPQNVQWSGFLVSPPLTLLISEPGQEQDTSHHSRYPTGQSGRTHDREGEHAPMRRRERCRRPASSIIEEAP